jgi:hypothetical protein
MDQNKNLVGLGERLGDAFVPITVAVDQDERAFA